MATILSYPRTNGNSFPVSYPYYGLFRTANVRLLFQQGEPVFECELVSGNYLLLKKQTASQRWVEAESNRETSLSSVLGLYIEDVIKDAV